MDYFDQSTEVNCIREVDCNLESGYCYPCMRPNSASQPMESNRLDLRQRGSGHPCVFTQIHIRQYYSSLNVAISGPLFETVVSEIFQAFPPPSSRNFGILLVWCVDESRIHKWRHRIIIVRKECSFHFIQIQKNFQNNYYLGRYEWPLDVKHPWSPPQLFS